MIEQTGQPDRREQRFLNHVQWRRQVTLGVRPHQEGILEWLGTAFVQADQLARSSQPWHGNDMNTFADDLATLIEHLDLQRTVRIGFSMGGMGCLIIHWLAWPDPTD